MFLSICPDYYTFVDKRRKKRERREDENISRLIILEEKAGRIAPFSKGPLEFIQTAR